MKEWALIIFNNSLNNKLDVVSCHIITRQVDVDYNYSVYCRGSGYIRNVRLVTFSSLQICGSSQVK